MIEKREKMSAEILEVVDKFDLDFLNLIIRLYLKNVLNVFAYKI
jgi:hypothetical protein